MSPLQSGSDAQQPSYQFAMADSSQVGEARRFALVLCSDLGFDETRKGRVGIIINELGNNCVRYAKSASLIVRTFSVSGHSGIEILAIDAGPGMDVSFAMRDGFSTGATPGTGLGAIKRQSDLFDFYSIRPRGTVIVSQVFSKAISGARRAPYIEIGAVSVPVSGEILCGDAWCVHETADGYAVLVADGLGHGPMAHAAAALAVKAFTVRPNATVGDLMPLVHAELKGSRGAAVFLIAVDPTVVSFVGAGNVRAVVQSAGSVKNLISQNGTAGVQIGTVRPMSQAWDGEGFLIVHTDGINSRWHLDAYPGIFLKHPAIVAGVLFRDAVRLSDDSTVIVVRRTRE